MVFAQNFLSSEICLLQQRQRLLISPKLNEGGPKIVECEQCLLVLGSEQAQSGIQDATLKTAGSFVIAQLTQGHCKVIHRGDCVDVFTPKQPHSLFEHALLDFQRFDILLSTFQRPCEVTGRQQRPCVSFPEESLVGRKLNARFRFRKCVFAAFDIEASHPT